MDAHSSRFHPSVVAAARERGIDLFFFPGGLTALVQLMDQLFGGMKAVHGKMLRAAYTAAGSRDIGLQAQIRIWAEAKREGDMGHARRRRQGAERAAQDGHVARQLRPGRGAPG